MIDLKQRAMQAATLQSDEIARMGEDRGLSGRDLFVAFAGMIGAQNPNLARKTLEALMRSVMLRAKGRSHASDCAVHNAPAYAPGGCNCGAALQ